MGNRLDMQEPRTEDTGQFEFVIDSSVPGDARDVGIPDFTAALEFIELVKQEVGKDCEE